MQSGQKSEEAVAASAFIVAIYTTGNFLSSVAVSLDCGRYVGMVHNEEGVGKNFAHALVAIIYTSTYPLMEGFGSAPVCS